MCESGEETVRLAMTLMPLNKAQLRKHLAQPLKILCKRLPELFPSELHSQLLSVSLLLCILSVAFICLFHGSSPWPRRWQDMIMTPQWCVEVWAKGTKEGPQRGSKMTSLLSFSLGSDRLRKKGVFPAISWCDNLNANAQYGLPC